MPVMTVTDMPATFDTDLSKPATREQLHTRNITCQAFRRDDGLYDIEGEMRDRKHYAFPNDLRGTVDALEPYHHMQVRLTVNSALTVVDAEAKTLAGPFRVCPEAAINVKGMVGLTIGPGWRRACQKAIGGPAGCTHITELMGPMATTALQTIFGEEARQKRAGMSDVDKQNRPTSSLRNSCLAFADGGDVARANWENPAMAGSTDSASDT